MFQVLGVLIAFCSQCCRSRRDLLLENVALRQQLSIIIRNQTRRRLTLPDKLFRIALSRFWSGWKRALLSVQPETVVRWHCAGFKLYWEWIFRKRGRFARKPTSKELRELIFRIVAENPTWEAHRFTAS